MLDDPRAVCLGGEPVRLAGTTAGRVTSGGYGHRVGRSIAFAYLPAASSEPGAAVEVDLFGELVPGVVADTRCTTPSTRASAAEEGDIRMNCARRYVQGSAGPVGAPINGVRRR